MNRRGFLGLLMAAAGGLVLDPKVLLWKPAEVVALPPVRVGAITGLDAMTRYLAQYLSERWSGRIVDSDVIGRSGLTTQFSADFLHPPSEIGAEGLDAERFLDPIGAEFVRRIRELRAIKFGELRTKIPGATTSRYTHVGSGISVRGLSQYDIFLDAERVRFDVVCGAA